MAQEVAKITIVMNDAGQINVDGAIDNKMIAFGLLELAKEAVIEYHKAAQQRIKLAPGPLAVGPLKPV